MFKNRNKRFLDLNSKLLFVYNVFVMYCIYVHLLWVLFYRRPYVKEVHICTQYVIL